LALIVGTGLVTLALWQSQTTQGAIVLGGELKLTLGDVTWACADQCTDGDVTDLAALALGPGQSIVLRQSVQSDFIGDNLVVSLTADLTDPPAGWAASWHIDLAGGTTLPDSGDLALGQTIVVPPDLEGVARSWTVVVTLTAPADSAEWIDPSTQTPPDTSVGFGQLTITANQLRCGPGFDVACPGSEVVDD